MSTPTPYISFLIRLWREPEQESTGDWHSEVRHIQSDRCWTFASLDETLEFLRRRVGGPEASSLDEDGETESEGQSSKGPGLGPGDDEGMPMAVPRSRKEAVRME